MGGRLKSFQSLRKCRHEPPNRAASPSPSPREARTGRGLGSGVLHHCERPQHCGAPPLPGPLLRTERRRGSRKRAAFMPLQRDESARVRTRWDVQTLKRRERRAPFAPVALRPASALFPTGFARSNPPPRDTSGVATSCRHPGFAPRTPRPRDAPSTLPPCTLQRFNASTPQPFNPSPASASTTGSSARDNRISACPTRPCRARRRGW